MPVMPALIGMEGVIIILFGILLSIWWLVLIGLVITFYPYVAVAIMLNKDKNKRLF
jgi:hypothetical protein